MDDNGKVDLELAQDEKGIPILLAVRSPGQVAAQPNPSGAIVRRGARSGNPQFDPATGRFAGSGSTLASQQPDIEIVANARTLPQGVTQEQWERRQDVVRELARQTQEFNDKSLVRFLRKNPNVQEVASIDLEVLKRDVRAQQLDDLVDILDAQLKSRIDVRKNVRLQAPRGWVKQGTARFTDEEMLDVAKRLEGRGYGTSVIKKQVVGQVQDEERRKKLEQLYSEQTKRGKK